MRHHIRFLSALFAVTGGAELLAGAVLVLGSLGGGLIAATQQDTRFGVLLGAWGMVIGLGLVVGGLPSLIVGAGLWRHRPWARWLGLVLSGLHVLAFPVGTVLGGYGLWVLLSAEGAAWFGASVGVLDYAAASGGVMLGRDPARDSRGRGPLSWLFSLALLVFAGIGVVSWLQARPQPAPTARVPEAERPTLVPEPRRPQARTPEPSPSREPVEAAPAPAAEKAIYRFLDDDGSMHFVDALEQVPAKHRRTAVRLEP